MVVVDDDDDDDNDVEFHFIQFILGERELDTNIINVLIGWIVW